MKSKSDYMARWVVLVGTIFLISWVQVGNGSTQFTLQDPKADKVPQRDDPEILVNFGHSHSVTTVAFSPSGHHILTGGEDGTAHLWETGTGAEMRLFTNDISDIIAVEFSPAGRYVLAGSKNGAVHLWETATGSEIRSFAGDSSGIYAVAFSPDGRHVLTGNTDGTARLWEITTGEEVRVFSGHDRQVTAVAFAPNGRYVMTGSGDKTACLWEMATGVKVHTFAESSIRLGVSDVVFSPDGRFVLIGDKGGIADLWEIRTGEHMRVFTGPHTFSVTPIGVSPDSLTAMAFSPDGRHVLTGNTDGTARLWEITTGEEVRVFTGHDRQVTAVAFAPDGRYVLTGSADKTARLWETTTGEEVRVFTGQSKWVTSIAFSPNGHHVLSAGGDATWLWNMRTGKGVRTFAHDNSTVLDAMFSPDGRHVLTGNTDRIARLWEITTGEEVRVFTGHDRQVTAVAFAPDGRYVLTGSADKTARLWETTTGEEVRVFSGHDGQVTAVAFAPDGQTVLTGSWDKTARLWGTTTGEEVRVFSGHDRQVTSVAFAPDGQTVLTGSADKTARLWETSTGALVRTFIGHSAVSAVAFAPDGQLMLSGGSDKTARLWETETGLEVRVFTGHRDWVNEAVFSPNGRLVLTGSGDSSVRLWDVNTGSERAQLMSLENGTWIVIAPDGRFDTNNLEEPKGIHWLMPDDPLHALPLEIFMRDYYIPRLLPRLLAGESFPTIRSLADLNRVQPHVEIVSIKTEPASPDLVTVTVEVEKGMGEFEMHGQMVKVETGVYNLRLFRDGQFVGTSHPSASDQKLAQPGSSPKIENALLQWRNENEIPIDPKIGKATLTFPHIRLPRRADLKSVQFSAYAFNEDRVKSAPARKVYELPQGLQTVKGRAYLITVGVNNYEDPTWNLTFAAHDARRIQEVLMARLKEREHYQQVVPIPLLADTKVTAGLGQLTENDATKAHIQGVLDLLAGRPIDPDLNKHIPNAADIQPARPEDLVLISFSSHGHTEKDGTFYFFPSDIGTGHGRAVTQDLLKHTISSEQMAEWLQTIDAGELIMIVDACHSAATVEAGGFKPGPMGSRGLGQLAYDKGMRILTASQAEDVALESRLLKQGLLSYALVQDGLEGQQADFQPADNTIFLKEWLQYAVERVPKLYNEVQSGFFTAKGVTAHFGKSAQDLAQAQPGLQQPSLFDFRKTGEDVELSHVVPGIGP